ncbi:nuclease-related domain-containing protein [Planococcus salinarum]|uniref:nuclease-related domain-containing protein n=1 Tax=Planococcus salinarum TaxID=622695 RepID=UPI000E3E0488|nr:nuclease-related domain-containing protein [Planococcus salinarum]TAA72895.1 NERD domain-containing protein [Planococcus salinarum]
MAKIIIKHRKRPAVIAGFQALAKRLPLSHLKQEVIKERLNSINAGFGGEERLDHLMKYFDPDYPHLIIQDLPISTNVDFQVDTLLLTQSCAILLEVKNLSGRLRFTVNPSALHQTKASGEEKGYQSPLVQAEVIKWKFENVLTSLGFDLPVQAYVVIAYPNQIVVDSPPGSVIWSADEVMIRLHNFNMPPEKISEVEMQQLGQRLLNLSSEFNPFPLAAKHGISTSEIGTGVYCPDCKTIKMERCKRSWHCPACKLKSSDAHHEAISEWFMLIKPSISAAECKKFLELEHLSKARNILKNPLYKRVGNNKMRRYYREMHVGIHKK